MFVNFNASCGSAGSDKMADERAEPENFCDQCRRRRRCCPECPGCPARPPVPARILILVLVHTSFARFACAAFAGGDWQRCSERKNERAHLKNVCCWLKYKYCVLKKIELIWFDWIHIFVIFLGKVFYRIVTWDSQKRVYHLMNLVLSQNIYDKGYATPWFL